MAWKARPLLGPAKPPLRASSGHATGGDALIGVGLGWRIGFSTLYLIHILTDRQVAHTLKLGGVGRYGCPTWAFTLLKTCTCGTLHLRSIFNWPKQHFHEVFNLSSTLSMVFSASNFVYLAQ